MTEIEDKTGDNSVITVMPALNYGGRTEIISAVKKLSNSIASGELSPSELNEEIFEKYHILSIYIINRCNLLI